MITADKIHKCIDKKKSPFTKEVLKKFLESKNIVVPPKATNVQLCALIKENVSFQSIVKKKTKKQLLAQCKSRKIPCTTKMKVGQLYERLANPVQKAPVKSGFQTMTVKDLKAYAKKKKIKGYSSLSTKKQLVQYLTTMYDPDKINLNTWTFINAPGFGDCGFHAISIGMKLFYAELFPFLTNRQEENVAYLRKTLITLYLKRISDLQTKIKKYSVKVRDAIRKTLSLERNFLSELAKVGTAENLTETELQNLRSNMQTLLRFINRHQELTKNPSEWLQDMDLPLFAEHFNICFAICEKNSVANYTLWTTQVPSSCKLSGTFVESCYQQNLPIIYLLSEYSLQYGEDLSALMQNIAGVHYDLLYPNPKGNFRYPKLLSVKNYEMEDAVLLFEPGGREGFLQAYQVLLTSQDQEEILEDEISTRESDPRASISSESLQQGQVVSSDIQTSNSSEKKSKSKQVIVSKPEQQQVKTSAKLTQQQLRQKIKKCFAS